MANKYFKWSKISEWTFRNLVRSFAEDQTATKAAKENGLSVRTVDPIFLRIRERIAVFGDVAISASAVQVKIFRFGPKTIQETPEPGLGQKNIALVLYTEDDKVFLETISDKTRATIHPILQMKIPLETEIRTNCMHTYDSLKALGFLRHIQTKQEIEPFRDSQYHGAPEIQRFWWNVRKGLKKFLGLPMKTRRLHLKERAFRHNHKNEDLYKLLLELLRNHPL